jgi:hypothetical protein
MPPKGRYTKRAVGMGRKYPRSVQDKSATKIQRMVRKAIANNNRKTLEVKQAVSTITDGDQITHNNFITLDSRLLETTQGVKDPSTSNTECRIGDQITLRGCKIKMFVELNERYSSCEPHALHQPAAPWRHQPAAPWRQGGAREIAARQVGGPEVRKITCMTFFVGLTDCSWRRSSRPQDFHAQNTHTVSLT